MAFNKGFKTNEINRITKIIFRNEEEFKEKFRRHIR